ncbi:YebC/PmpR family DNA-binding transcriptional regulator [Candidatus Falkowbacteria bacterium CG02_land_8_20_14_3_00_36_14]|uniref:Probable transcriptional regulatory protein COS18_02120 n=1 Tax=Candidatus Falkowbacteria bacterium CG02_land_8_20_14_3_00_36_14 TaxID=1974560 RepID=A0A2M7DPN4_9BACT|nr:MAG: YebC/PmpR family DNA-binding transcriptional regulator [Candidatus Falkowbacteria bacterium CG02_land_8_20_14_3_00_36_14]
MSGHSKWATTKRQKATVDAKRGAIFTKLGNLIAMAAREKGGDPNANFSLRMAVGKAKQANMPKENIERAIKRGTGELAGNAIEELIYEGFGPAKSQFIIRCLTDNKNRSASNIRHIFTEYGGSLGSVLWNFSQKGVIRIVKDELDKANLDKEIFELELIDAGAEDFLSEEEGLIIYTKIENLQAVRQFLENNNLAVESAGIEYVAKENLTVSEEEKDKIEKFIEALEDNEDAADYYTNIDI